jgi:hypothetical protein
VIAKDAAKGLVKVEEAIEKEGSINDSSTPAAPNASSAASLPM